MSKTLNNTNAAAAAKQVSDIEFFGDGDQWQLLGKASSVSQGWMKSSKAMEVPGGCVVQVTTQQRNPDGSYAIAEAVTYVPGVVVEAVKDETGKVTGRKLVSPHPAYK